MMKLAKKFVEFLKDEEGQTSTEYILLLVIVAIVVVNLKNKLSTNMDKLTDGIFNKAEDLLQQLN